MSRRPNASAARADDVPARLRPRQVRLDDERAAAVPADRGRGLFGLLPRLVIAEGHVHAARREGGGDGGADARAAGDEGGAASELHGERIPVSCGTLKTAGRV